MGGDQKLKNQKKKNPGMMIVAMNLRSLNIKRGKSYMESPPGIIQKKNTMMTDLCSFFVIKYFCQYPKFIRLFGWFYRADFRNSVLVKRRNKGDFLNVCILFL
jgi:hypothetical protein